MAVTLSWRTLWTTVVSTVSRRPFSTGILWISIAIAGFCMASGRVTADEAPGDAHTLSQQLYDQAKAATTFTELNRILAQAESLRTRSTNAKLTAYLSNLEAWVLHRRGEAYAQQAAEATTAGKPDISRQLDVKAMEDFDAAIRLDPKRWKSYHHRGVCYALAGEFSKALDDFTETIELRPDYESAWFNRGEVHYELGQFAKAIADYDEAIRLQSQDAGYFASRGHAHFQLRDFQRALDDYQHAVELDPQNPQRLINRGEAYRSLGQWEPAANDFREAVNLDNQFGPAFQSAAWLMSTCPDPQYRHADLAVRAAQKAIELEGDQDYIYLDTLAAALASRGTFDKAQEVQRRAIQLAPPENAGPLKQRLELYRTKRPFRQVVEDAPSGRMATGQTAPQR